MTPPRRALLPSLVLLLCVATLLFSAVLAAAIRPTRYHAEFESDAPETGAT